MNIMICEKAPEKYVALHTCFMDSSNYITYHGSILDIKDYEAIVSPANSFGYMDGGIDKAYSESWPKIQEVVQKAIFESQDFGELLVGKALCVDVPDSITYKKMIVAPTMRIPSKVPTYHAYIATRAAMQCALENGVRSIAIPGMGTGHGGIPPKEAGWAMRKGIEDAIRGFPLYLKNGYPLSWKGVAAHHIRIGYPIT